MLYQQKQEIIEDGFGKVTAVFRIADTYPALFSGSPIEVDIFEFGSSKKTADTATGEQKEDEFDFSINAAKINSMSDYNAMVFALECQSSDRWVALFLHEGNTFSLGNVADKEFSGLARRKANARDLLWHGAEWSGEPEPLRDWKFSAQSFGTATLDSVNMDDVTDDEVTTQGIINEIMADSAWLTANVVRPNLWASHVDIYHHSAIAINAILEKFRLIAETRIKATIPDYTLTFEPCNSGHKFTPSIPTPATVGAYDFARYEPDTDMTHALPLRLFDSGSGRQGYVSKTMLSPVHADEVFDKAHSWLRFESLTDFLYNFALAMGCSLSITENGAAGVTVKFVPLVGNEGAAVYLKDATSGDIDIQQVSNTEKSSVYRADPASYIIEGMESVCVDEYSYPFADALLTPPNDVDANKLACVSIAPTLYDSQVKGRTFKPWGYSPYFLASSHYTHSGIHFYDESTGNFVPAYSVIYEIGGTAKNFLKLGDCINDRLVAGVNRYSIEYSVSIPYVSSFSNNADGSAPSWKTLKLWGGVSLDGVSYTITDIERDYSKWQTKIKLTNSSKYAFASTLPETPSRGIMPPRVQGAQYVAGEQIYSGVPMAMDPDGFAVVLLPWNSHMNRYIGVAVNDAAQGERVVAVDSGRVKLYGFSASNRGEPVYWRASGASHSPLLTDYETEEVSMRLGQAVDAQGTVELKDYSEITHRRP